VLKEKTYEVELELSECENETSLPVYYISSILSTSDDPSFDSTSIQLTELTSISESTLNQEYSSP